jgi:hypothetical protein
MFFDLHALLCLYGLLCKLQYYVQMCLSYLNSRCAVGIAFGSNNDVNLRGVAMSVHRQGIPFIRYSFLELRLTPHFPSLL